MAKQKKNQKQPSTAETDPITPTPDPTLEGQADAPPEGANPVGGAVEPNLPAAMDTEAGDPPLHVNDVDTPPTGTEIVLAEVFGDMLDVTIEEPTYPAHEWQTPAETPLVLPDKDASNEDLIEGARQLVQSVTMRLRRTVQEWWLVGRHLILLKARPENEGRWRGEILPQIGVNHETDHQLRKMAELVPFEACLNYPNKSELLREIGVLPPKKPKQLSGPQTDTMGSNEAKVQNRVEEIFGIGSEATYEFRGVEDGPFTQAAPCEDIPNQFGAEVEPLAGIVADEATHPTSVADPKSRPKADGKTHPQADAKKVAAKAAPQPKEDDPIPGTEALVITLSGAEVADMEAAAAESGLILLVKTQDQIVGLLWYADDPHKVATERVGKALAKLRPVKKKFKVEARYLGVFDSITV